MKVREQKFRLHLERPDQTTWAIPLWKPTGPIIFLQADDLTEEAGESSAVPEKGIVTYHRRKPTKPHTREMWMAERSLQAMAMLRDTVTCDPQIRRGVPVLKGTRVTISQILAALAEGSNINELADDLSLNITTIEDFLHGLAIHLSRSIAHYEDPI